MPDSDRPIRSNRLVERFPRRQVCGGARLCVSHELIHRPPILNHDRCACEPHLCMDQPQLWLSMQFDEHARHRTDHRQPLVNLQRRIDSHANHEHNEVAIHVRGHPFSSNHGVCPGVMQRCSRSPASHCTARYPIFTSGRKWADSGDGVVQSPTVAPPALPFLFLSLGLPSHVGPDIRDPSRLLLEAGELLPGEHQVGRQGCLARLASCDSAVENRKATNRASESGRAGHRSRAARGGTEKFHRAVRYPIPTYPNDRTWADCRHSQTERPHEIGLRRSVCLSIIPVLGSEAGL